MFSFINVYSNTNQEKMLTKENVGDKIQYDKLIELAYIYIDKNTEYAFNCVYKAYSIAEQNRDNSKSAECNIIMGDIFKANNSYPTAVSYYDEAIKQLDAIKEYNTICDLYIKIAELYQNGEFEDRWSIDALNKALKYAEIIDEPSTYNNIYMAYGNLYAAKEKYDSATEYYNKILKSKITKNNIGLVSTALTNKANIFIKLEEYEKAMNTIDSSLYLCIRDFNDSLQVINYSYKAEIYDSIRDFKQAEKYYKQSAKLAYEIQDFDNCAKNMLSLGHLNQNYKHYNEAIKIFKMICDSTEKFKMHNICHLSYYQLSKCYASLGRYEEAYSAFNKYDVYYDSTYVIKQKEKISELRNNYLLTLNLKELKTKEIEEKNKQDNRREWQIFISVIIVLTMISITFIILYSKNKALFHKNEVTTYEQQLKIDKIENDLMEYQLKSNRELLITMALHLKSYIEFINPLKEELKEALELSDNEQKNKIKNIYLNIQNNIHIFNNTENLNKKINVVYKDFLDRLEEKHPELTKSEKKLCTMLYINMSSKEIAAITNTTIRTIETSRYRLRKKFMLSRDEDIVSFLQKI